MTQELNAMRSQRDEYEAKSVFLSIFPFFTLTPSSRIPSQ